ncbi:MAG: DUF1722 domain-containing protein [Nitrococcus sp.]|nr:DUF1722 domain-containing protein [Nitrococcus sp.]
MNRQSLLGEHRELHGLYSILVQGKKGYSRHPETQRWVGSESGLARRHAVLVAEMGIRGYSHRSPIAETRCVIQWPEVFVTPPQLQYDLLKSKYQHRPPGRIPLAQNAQQLWAQHKYSVMARDPATCRAIGRRVAQMRHCSDCSALAKDLTLILRETPKNGRLVNVLEHMWGHVSDEATDDDRKTAEISTADLLCKTVELAARLPEPYLMASTALSDLAVYIHTA